MTDTDDVKFDTAELENLRPNVPFSAGRTSQMEKRSKWKKPIKVLIALVLVATLAFAGFRVFRKPEGPNMEDATRTATVERQTIQSSISSSGTLAALDT